MRLRDLFHRAKCLLGGREFPSGTAEQPPLPDFVQEFVATVAKQRGLRADFMHLVDAEPLRRAEILSSWLLAQTKHTQDKLSVERLCAFFSHEQSFRAVVRELERVQPPVSANHLSPTEGEADSKKEYPIAS